MLPRYFYHFCLTVFDDLHAAAGKIGAYTVLLFPLLQRRRATVRAVQNDRRAIRSPRTDLARDAL